MTEQMKMDAELRQFLAAPDHFRDAAKMVPADHVEQPRAMVVPDGYALVPVEPTLEMVAALGFNGDIELAIGHGAIGEEVIEQYSAMLAASPAAPTVNAEQLDERDVLLAEARMVISAVLAECDLETELSWMCERISKGRRIYVDERAISYAQAPSLPASGSAVEEVEVVAVVRAIGFGRVFEPVHADSIYLHCSAGDQLMTVAQHQRIVAALQRNTCVGDPILVEAVAITRHDDEKWLYLDWLLEGGVCALEQPGQILMVAHGKVLGDDGHGQVYTAPVAARPGGVRVPKEFVVYASEIVDMVIKGDAPETLQRTARSLMGLLAAQAEQGGGV